MDREYQEYIRKQKRLDIIANIVGVAMVGFMIALFMLALARA